MPGGHDGCRIAKMFGWLLEGAVTAEEIKC